jgi:sugar lactone lactonase YvrE
MRPVPVIVSVASFAAALVIAPAVVVAQGSPFELVPEMRRESAAGNHARAIVLADSMVALVPHHPNALFTRAAILLAAGRDEDAERDVRRLLRWDARYARFALRDTAFTRLRPRFAGTDVAGLAARADEPVSRGEVWATIEERDLILEGSAWDPATRSMLVGSLHKNTVLAIAPDGRVSERVKRRDHGLGSVVGIHVDSARELLWVTSVRRFDDPADTARAALFAFHAATGEFRRRVDAPDPGAFLNDLTTGPDGTVYVTDSRGGGVWLLRPGATAFERLTATGRTLAPNGITITPDGSHLFVSDMDRILVADLRSGRSWPLEVPDSVVVTGIDGLAFARGALIAHHPLTFWRIARYDVDASFRRITGLSFIERNSPDSRTSTTGEVVGDMYYYIGNGQIDRMNQRRIDAATMDPIRIYRAPLAHR